jgi:hypothetical protein
MSEHLPATIPPSTQPLLRGQKRKFAEAYCRTGNEIKAACAAGAKYRGEREMAYKMLADPVVQAFIRYRNEQAMHGLTPTVDAIRSEIHALAHGNLGDIIELDGNGTVKGFDVTLLDRRIVSQVRFTFHDNGSLKDATFRAHPKLEALRAEAQMAGMLTDESAKQPPVVNVTFHAPVQINQAER